jgi:hypothetical protein
MPSILRCTWLQLYGCTSSRFGTKKQAVSHTQTWVLEYYLDCLIGQCDWQICSAQSVITNHMIFAEETPVHLKVDEFSLFIRNTYGASGFRCTSNWQLLINWSPLLHHSQHSIHVIYHAIGQLGELLISCINSFHLKWSLIINKNANEIPL